MNYLVRKLCIGVSLSMGLVSGANATYVNGNPLKYTDPTGLILNVAPSLQSTVSAMQNSSSSFSNLTGILNGSSNTYNLKPGTLPDGVPAVTICSFGGGCNTILDLAQLAKINYATKTGTQACMSTDRAIGHELSHALYHEQLPAPFNWISPHSFIIGNENTIMNQVNPASPDRDPYNDTLYKRQ